MIPGGKIVALAVCLAADLAELRLFFEPEILGAPTDLGGWLIEPCVGLSLQF